MLTTANTSDKSFTGSNCDDGDDYDSAEEIDDDRDQKEDCNYNILDIDLFELDD